MRSSIALRVYVGRSPRAAWGLRLSMDSPTIIAEKLRVLRARIGSREAVLGGSAGDPVRSRRAASTSYRSSSGALSQLESRPFTTAHGAPEKSPGPPARSPAGSGGGALAGLAPFTHYPAHSLRPGGGSASGVSPSSRLTASTAGGHAPTTAATEYARTRAAAAAPLTLYHPQLLAAASGRFSARRDDGLGPAVPSAGAASQDASRALTLGGSGASGGRTDAGAGGSSSGSTGYAYSAPQARPAALGSQLPVRAGPGVSAGAVGPSPSLGGAAPTPAAAAQVAPLSARGASALYPPQSLQPPQQLPSARRLDPLGPYAAAPRAPRAAPESAYGSSGLEAPVQRSLASAAVAPTPGLYPEEEGGRGVRTVLRAPSGAEVGAGGGIRRSAAVRAPSAAGAAADDAPPMRTDPRGLVGLVNLGNTW